QKSALDDDMVVSLSTMETHALEEFFYGVEDGVIGATDGGAKGRSTTTLSQLGGKLQKLTGAHDSDNIVNDAYQFELQARDPSQQSILEATVSLQHFVHRARDIHLNRKRF